MLRGEMPCTLYCALETYSMTQNPKLTFGKGLQELFESTLTHTFPYFWFLATMILSRLSRYGHRVIHFERACQNGYTSLIAMTSHTRSRAMQFSTLAPADRRQAKMT
jgi:hypothetical protein